MTLHQAMLLIESEIRATQDRAAEKFKGFELTAIIEITRSIDLAAFALTLLPRNKLSSMSHAYHSSIIRGSAIALEPFVLDTIRTDRGIPWNPSTIALRKMIDSYLVTCGQLAYVYRLICATKYGLARVEVSNANVRVEVVNDSGEHVDLSDGESLANQIDASSAFKEEALRRKKQIRKRIEKYVGVANGWFIKYHADERSMRYHNRLAASRSLRTVEHEALPKTSSIQGHLFSDWLELCDAAQGRVLHHVAAGTVLTRRHKSLDIRNLMTLYCRRDDLDTHLQEFRLAKSLGIKSLESMGTDATDIRSNWLNHRIPLPYYIDLGSDFVLLPAYGALLAPTTQLVHGLKTRYRADWDRAVNDRESDFRSDLAHILSPKGYFVSQRGVDIRDASGQLLTDIDAVVVELATGRLFLVQLKWNDPFGTSLRERASRMSNLAEANKWVERVSSWSHGKTAEDLGLDLKLAQGDVGQAPKLIVLTRYATKFTGSQEELDSRASWLTWSALKRHCTADMSGETLSNAIAAHKHTAILSTLTMASSSFKFSSFSADIFPAAT